MLLAVELKKGEINEFLRARGTLIESLRRMRVEELWMRIRME